MHSRPTAQELIEAVQQHLAERVLPALDDPQLRFQTRVAAHVLGVVAREMAQGEQSLWQEWAVLTALLGERRAPPEGRRRLEAEVQALNHRLAAQIRAGERDDDPNVPLFLRQQVAARLDVWNPQFRR